MSEQKKANLKLSTVKAKSKEMDTTEKYEIQSESYRGEQITFNPLFSEIKIENLLKEFGKLLNEAQQKEITISEEMNIYLIQFLIIKHFTHFKKDISDSLIGDKKNAGILDWLDHFRKTGLLKECLEKMFLQKEIRKVFGRMTDFASSSLLAMQLNEEMNKKFEQMKLRNADVFEELENIKVEQSLEKES
jgi:hypothetical protein